MIKVLLFGATGLIGSEVYQKLRNDFEIIRFGRREECEIKGDLSKPETLSNLDFKGIDVIIHCAGVTDEDFKSHIKDAFIQNLIGMNAIVRLAIVGNVKKFFYISTSHVYGLQEGRITEASPSNPLSDYAIAHYAAEQILRRNSNKFENVFILRPNAVFGTPNFLEKFNRWNLIPYSFPLEAVYNEKIVLKSTGEQNRNFIGTKDIANYIYHLLKIKLKQEFLVINPIGNKTISVYNFALKCAEIYEFISHRECKVERLAPLLTNNTEEFLYQTEFEFSLEKVILEDSLTDLIGIIFKEFKNGKRYQA
jgi:UDP-glucose 4-epimerase